MDLSVWRIRPDAGPLVAATGRGPLDGETVAVKDLFAVAGQRIGAGNPAWLGAAPVETEHAWAVGRLLDAGAAVAGLARTEEFAYSLTGANAHYGTPPNPRAPGRISGGSTSGPATAVASGEASIGLGTDTGGSIRVPAAYQGLWGIRPTHGAVPVDGVLPLAPSFDTVGWLTRDAGLLARVGEVLLPPDTAAAHGPLLTSDALRGLAEPGVGAAVGQLVADAGARLGRAVRPVPWSPEPGWLAAFQTVQAAEAWASHGAWLEGRLDTLGAAVRGRFERARAVTAGELADALGVVASAREQIRERLGDGVLVLPSAASVAPRSDAAAEEVRAATMLLTCVAGLGGLPGVSVPVTTADGLPAGACLVGPAGSDRELLALAASLGG